MTDWAINYKEWVQRTTANDKGFIFDSFQLNEACIHNGTDLPDVSLNYVPFICIVWIVCLHYPESNQPFAIQILFKPFKTVFCCECELLPREQCESEALIVRMLRNLVVNTELNFFDLIDDSINGEFH